MKTRVLWVCVMLLGGSLILCGCSRYLSSGASYSLGTPYTPSGTQGGYSDTYLGNDIYLITVRVNAFTDEITAYEYFHRRAVEIMTREGYSDYELLELGTSSKRRVYYVGNRPHIYEKPRVYGRIKYYRETKADTLKTKDIPEEEE